ncbi:MAG: DUF4349 domain-containing protein [Ruminococcaceae bacterium]|nr:DUF4349 domain-containing protein [Oscillospiraceae bacterium]
MKLKKLWIMVALVLVFSSLLAGCGAGESKAAVDYGYKADDMVAPENSVELSTNEGKTQSAMPANQKLIRKVRMTAETEQMDALLTSLDQRITELGGYVENRQVTTSADSRSTRRSADLTIRIPAENLDGFVNKISETANVLSVNETAEDITLSYVATESRIKALETEQTRLLELLAAAENMEDLLTIESRLTDVRTELEQVNSLLRVYDNQVNYATVELSIQQVQEFTEVREAPDGFFERAWNVLCNVCSGIGKFFQELGIILIGISPIWVPCLVGFIAWRYFRKRKKKNQK